MLKHMVLLGLYLSLFIYMFYRPSIRFHKNFHINILIIAYLKHILPLKYQFLIVLFEDNSICFFYLSVTVFSFFIISQLLDFVFIISQLLDFVFYHISIFRFCVYHISIFRFCVYHISTFRFCLYHISTFRFCLLSYLNF